eukprot:TRINITY_DN6583_c1_g6_i1.p1 TRINITY_DN6583_c1_g6~~TRINITY_DN6583_c1_g6_i1.p1  ORF type:complete len:364 (+),score=46.41 TRINITY_DN6583_c1_g6_i1:88-1179(+)
MVTSDSTNRMLTRSMLAAMSPPATTPRCRLWKKENRTAPPGLYFGPKQDVKAALRELEEYGFGLQNPTLDIGCAYHDFSQGSLCTRIDPHRFPKVLELIKKSICSMGGCKFYCMRLNIIARHYEGPVPIGTDRLCFHADNFVVEEAVYGCILRQDGIGQSATVLEFREHGSDRHYRMEEFTGHLFLQTGEVRHRWSHGVPGGGQGPIRQSLTWRWLRPSFVKFNEMESQLCKAQQRRWLQKFVGSCCHLGVPQQVVEQFLVRWNPVCSSVQQEKYGRQIPCLSKKEAQAAAIRLPKHVSSRLAELALEGTSGIHDAMEMLDLLESVFSLAMSATRPSKDSTSEGRSAAVKRKQQEDEQDAKDS